MCTSFLSSFLLSAAFLFDTKINYKYDYDIILNINMYDYTVQYIIII